MRTDAKIPNENFKAREILGATRAETDVKIPREISARRSGDEAL
ncbi:hypothetical protein [uncultured Campylobacter sp.]|nr:hypothetical protein [uncultured Campylobacter sp.]